MQIAVVCFAGMDAKILEELMAVALKAVKAGARVHYRAGRGDLQVGSKSSPMDLVTQVDGETEEQIVSVIRSARPQDSIVGEEGTASSGSSNITWVIDPLDGTTNFVHGYPGHAVAIGVAMDGKRLFGVVCDTFHRRFYSATVGQHAVCDGRIIRVNETSDLSRALVGIGFLPDQSARKAQCEALATILPLVRDVRRSGCPALDFCAVASGTIDCYFESGLKRWDIAPGAAIAEAAGATVGEFVSHILPNPVILAANHTLFNAFADLLFKAGLIIGPAS
jgi:myo-inositol-1(or 4)-monophosphatase